MAVFHDGLRSPFSSLAAKPAVTNRGKNNKHRIGSYLGKGQIVDQGPRALLS
jgi:hypothetical protein